MVFYVRVCVLGRINKYLPACQLASISYAFSLYARAQTVTWSSAALTTWTDKSWLHPYVRAHVCVSRIANHIVNTTIKMHHFTHLLCNIRLHVVFFCRRLRGCCCSVVLRNKFTCLRARSSVSHQHAGAEYVCIPNGYLYASKCTH